MLAYHGRNIRKHVRGIPAIAGETRDGLHIQAGEGVAGSTMHAVSARSAEPTHSPTGTWFPPFDVFPYRLDRSDYFMPGNARVNDAGHLSFYRERIAMTNTAGLNAQQNLLRARLRNIALDTL